VTTKTADGAVYKGIDKSRRLAVIIENCELFTIGNAPSTSTAHIEEEKKQCGCTGRHARRASSDCHVRHHRRQSVISQRRQCCVLSVCRRRRRQSKRVYVTCSCSRLNKWTSSRRTHAVRSRRQRRLCVTVCRYHQCVGVAWSRLKCTSGGRGHTVSVHVGLRCCTAACLFSAAMSFFNCASSICKRVFFCNFLLSA